MKLSMDKTRATSETISTESSAKEYSFFRTQPGPMLRHDISDEELEVIAEKKTVIYGKGNGLSLVILLVLYH